MTANGGVSFWWQQVGLPAQRPALPGDRVVTADLHAYWRFQSDYLMRIPSVQSVKTDVPMETIKRSHELPLG